MTARPPTSFAGEHRPPRDRGPKGQRRPCGICGKAIPRVGAVVVRGEFFCQRHFFGQGAQ